MSTKASLGYTFDLIDVHQLIKFVLSGITPALRDVNLTISPGQKIAIRGRTGR